MHTKRNWLSVSLLVLLIIALVLPAVAGAQAENGITSPADGATVSGTVEVMGNASDPNFLRWDLFILPGGDDSAKIWVASGSDQGEFTVDLDTTKYPDGEHAFSLRVVRNDSNYAESVSQFTIANAGAPAAAAAPAEGDTIVDVAVAAGTFETLVAAVQAADLVDTLSSVGPFTVFAPTDEAFAKLPAGTVEGLLEDPAALANILTYHVVPGKVMAADVSDGLVAKTAQGANVTFSVADGVVKINDATVTATDVEASNGVIHVIDTVILPPTTAPATPAAAPSGNGITSPADGATVSGTATVTGNASLPDFKRWDLFILPGGDDAGKIWVASGDEQGEFSVDLDTTKYPDGEHAFSLRVVKADSNYDESVSKFTIANAGAPAAEEAAPAAEEAVEEEAVMAEETMAEEAAPAPAAPAAGENGITSPADGATVSGTATVTGNASDPNFKRWDLFILPGGDDAGKIWVASGDEQGEFSVDLDTTNFPNGDHAFSLRVVKNDSNYTEYTSGFTLAN